MVSDGAALMAAAVRAACLAKAPRRTVQAVAAAVAGVFISAAARTTPVVVAKEPAGARVTAVVDPEALLEAKRAARREKREKKKLRRAAAKATSSSRAPLATASTTIITPLTTPLVLERAVSSGGAAGGFGCSDAVPMEDVITVLSHPVEQDMDAAEEAGPVVLVPPVSPTTTIKQIKKGDDVVIVAGPHSGKAGRVTKVVDINAKGTEGLLKVESGGIHLDTLLSHVRAVR